METAYSTFLKAHVISGCISLVLFWMPVFLKKGSHWHNKIGKWYVYAMWVVVITAACLSIRNFIVGRTIMGAFLGFIALITAKPLWHGRAVLKVKKKQTVSYRYIHLALQMAIVCSSIAMITYGIYLKGEGAAILMFFFGGLGILDIPALIRNLKQPDVKVEWLKEHISAMLVSGIAAYTAFLVFGARQFLEAHFTGIWSMLPWVAPTIIGLWGIRFALKKYTPKNQLVS